MRNAMEYTLTEAAHATGLSRPTIFRAIKKGALSARREEDKSYRIDTSELARVFPAMSLKQDDLATRNGVKRHEIVETPAAPEAELALLRLELRMTKDQLARERDLRDQEQQSIERERETTSETVADLRRRLDRSEERVLALLAPPVAPPIAAAQIAAPAPLTPSKPLPGFLARLFGRA